MKEIPKRYAPEDYEKKWADKWLREKTFSSVPDERKPYTIVIPPPNVTGVLHMGHALNNVLQDIIIRFRRITGFNSMWLPGTDHGGIATQNVVEKMLLEEGLTRHDLGREKFLERMWRWKDESGGSIIGQLQRLGCGCDWDRLRFTMDPECSRAVKEAFIRLYEKGMIYRGEYMINWCPRCSTALSDIEVEHQEEKSSLWYIKYPLKGSPGEYVSVATTRPETMLGDTAVAVNPDDKRYSSLAGKKLLLPVIGRELEIISDSFVDSGFGTGAVKVTPGHDPNDFEMGRRHGLETVRVIDENARMTDEAGVFSGMDRYECRKKLVERLKDEGLIEKIEDYRLSAGRCYRCSTVIEPLISEQWFLKMKPLAEKALKASREGKVSFVPASWEKPYLNWLENIHDWCISRQIWWGHRIPVYYCSNEECPPVAAFEMPDKCPGCGSGDITQDEDVLDTWFSSALWPFSTLGWPDEGKDLKYYYPTDVLVTGHEILYLWVARMVMMGLEMMGEAPFENVDIHGIIRDEHGNKMSKSKGNVIDPLVIIEEFGTDALRFALAKSAVPGRDIQLSDDDFTGARNFSNKLWNAARLILANVEADDFGPLDETEDLELADRWILAQAERYAGETEKAYREFNTARACRLMYEFTWSLFCDWYLELVKLRLYGSKPGGKTARKVLLNVLIRILGILHPVMPFITSQLWEYISAEAELPSESPLDYNCFSSPELEGTEEAMEKMKLIIDVVSGIRNIRGESGIQPSAGIRGAVRVSGAALDIINSHSDYIKLLAGLNEFEAGVDIKRGASDSVAVCGAATVYVRLPEELRKQEISRLSKRIKEVQGLLENANRKLSNRDFTSRAPEEVVEKARERAASFENELEKLEKTLEGMI